MSYSSQQRRRRRPDTIYWVGHEDGAPLNNGQQKVQTHLPAAKGLLSNHRNRVAAFNRQRHPVDQINTGAAIYVANVTWTKLKEEEA